MDFSGKAMKKKIRGRKSNVNLCLSHCVNSNHKDSAAVHIFPDLLNTEDGTSGTLEWCNFLAMSWGL